MNRPTTIKVFSLFIRTRVRRILNRGMLANEVMKKKKAAAKGEQAPAPRTGTVRRGVRKSLGMRVVTIGFAAMMMFGFAFVTIMPGKDGLVHVSQISNDRVEKVGDVLKEGDIVKVKVLEVDKQGRIRLSMKAVEEGEGPSNG